MKNQIKSFVTATLTSSLLIGCSSFATYTPTTDDILSPKSKTCDIPISREPLKEGQKEVGEITITRGGIASNVRSNVSIEEAKTLMKQKGCEAGIDGIASFKELRIENATQNIQWEGKGYVKEN